MSSQNRYKKYFAITLYLFVVDEIYLWMQQFSSLHAFGLVPGNIGMYLFVFFTIYKLSIYREQITGVHSTDPSNFQQLFIYVFYVTSRIFY